MKLSIHHTTTYRYAQAFSRSTQLIRLTPRNHARQHNLSWHLGLPEPAPSFTDAFGNVTHLLSLGQNDPTNTVINLVAQGLVEVTPSESRAPEQEWLSPLVFLRPTELTLPNLAITTFVAPFRAKLERKPMNALTELMLALLDHMPYQKGTTTVTHTAAQSFATRSGVCQDHTHVYLACCKALGIPARYVSGYVYSPHHEEVASHAWAEAWININNRWASFDVSNAREAGDYHVQLAVGIDYLSACPVRGVRLGGGEETMETQAQVRLDESVSFSQQ